MVPLSLYFQSIAEIFGNLLVTSSFSSKMQLCSVGLVQLISLLFLNMLVILVCQPPSLPVPLIQMWGSAMVRLSLVSVPFLPLCLRTLSQQGCLLMVFYLLSLIKFWKILSFLIKIFTLTSVPFQLLPWFFSATHSTGPWDIASTLDSSSEAVLSEITNYSIIGTAYSFSQAFVYPIV